MDSSACSLETEEVLSDAIRAAKWSLRHYASKATLLEDANRSNISRRDKRMKWPLRFVRSDELLERCARDASPPMLFTEPKSNEPVLTLRPRQDVPCNVPIIDDDCLLCIARIRKHLLAPMREECIVLARWKCGHRDCFGLALMLEEDRQV